MVKLCAWHVWCAICFLDTSNFDTSNFVSHLETEDPHIRNLSSKNQRKRGIDHTQGRRIHVLSSRWYSEIVRRRLRIQRTHSKAGEQTVESEDDSAEIQDAESARRREESAGGARGGGESAGGTRRKEGSGRARERSKGSGRASEGSEGSGGARESSFNRQNQKMTSEHTEIFGRYKVTSSIVISLNLEFNFTCRKKKHSLLKFVSFPLEIR